MATTQNSPCGHKDEIAMKIERERQELIQARQDRFDALFAEWLTNRAEYMRPDRELTDEEEQPHSDREDELARLITTTPAVLPWMIFRKLEILEHYMGSQGRTAWTDNREVVRTVVRNDGADISERSFNRVLDRFGDAEDIQDPMVHRRQLPLTVAERPRSGCR